MTPVIFTIGHSLHPRGKFLSLLRAHAVTLLVDVRSVPFSRRAPHFSRHALEEWLPAAGIACRFFGDALGGRRGRDLLLRAEAPDFRAAIEELAGLAARQRSAIMCAEADPMNCHRAHLVAPALVAAGVAVRHILADASSITHRALEDRLLVEAGLADGDLFLVGREERLAQARRRLFARRRRRS